MNQWFIGVKRRVGDMFDLSDISIIDAPKGHYYADPFLVEKDGKTFVFFEDYDYTKGRIAVGELDGFQLKDVQTVIDEPWHVSFPSVIDVGGEYFMAPERTLAGSLWVYRCERFPDIWQQESLVARGRFDDPVIRITRNGWQVWATEDNKLVVFEAATLHSKWNVIRREDKPFMRSAGNFLSDGLRPTQDCVPTYGRAIKFLNETGDVVRTIEPDWYPDLTGTHTFNSADKYIVIDGRVKLS